LRGYIFIDCEITIFQPAANGPAYSGPRR